MNGSGITGGSQSSEIAPKGKRFLAALLDLLVIPFFLVNIASVIFAAVPEAIRNVLLTAVIIGWLFFRDAVFSPGRKLIGLKLVSLDGDQVSVGQAFIRNILLMIPFLSLFGCLFEAIFIIVKGNRLADKWAKT